MSGILGQSGRQPTKHEHDVQHYDVWYVIGKGSNTGLSECLSSLCCCPSWNSCVARASPRAGPLHEILLHFLRLVAHCFSLVCTQHFEVSSTESARNSKDSITRPSGVHGHFMAANDHWRRPRFPKDCLLFSRRIRSSLRSRLRTTLHEFFGTHRRHSCSSSDAAAT